MGYIGMIFLTSTFFYSAYSTKTYRRKPEKSLSVPQEIKVYIEVCQRSVKVNHYLPRRALSRPPQPQEVWPGPYIYEKPFPYPISGDAVARNVKKPPPGQAEGGGKTLSVLCQGRKPPRQLNLRTVMPPMRRAMPSHAQGFKRCPRNSEPPREVPRMPKPPHKA